MKRHCFSSGGFTVLEILVVVAIIGVLASIALPRYLLYGERARAAQCLSHRYQIEQTERARFLETGAADLTIDTVHQCPSGGVFFWIVSDPGQSDYPKIGCSLHYTGSASEGESDTTTDTDTRTDKEKTAKDKEKKAKDKEKKPLPEQSQGKSR